MTTENHTPVTVKERLFALDILRGIDIFWLTVVCTAVELTDYRYVPQGWRHLFIHADWVGFTLHDFIMPLFIFICGAAVPFGRHNWLHVVKRVALLWFLGLILQGGLLTPDFVPNFNFATISFFNNTLQAIACGYLACVLVAKIPNVWVRVAIPFVLAGGYTLFLHLCGDMTRAGNAAVVYETKFLSLFYPSPNAFPVRQIAAWGYAWWLTIPMFATMGLAGYEATRILKLNLTPYRRLGLLAAVGGGLLVLGGLLATFDPVIKRIYTASFVAFAMGVAYLMYAVMYYWGDILKWRKGTGLFLLFGKHSLLFYVISAFIPKVLHLLHRWF